MISLKKLCLFCLFLALLFAVVGVHPPATYAAPSDKRISDKPISRNGSFRLLYKQQKWFLYICYNKMVVRAIMQGKALTRENLTSHFAPYVSRHYTISMNGKQTAFGGSGVVEIGKYTMTFVLTLEAQSESQSLSENLENVVLERKKEPQSDYAVHFYLNGNDKSSCKVSKKNPKCQLNF